MKRRIFVLLLGAIVLAVLITGCGAKNSNEGNSEINNMLSNISDLTDELATEDTTTEEDITTEEDTDSETASSDTEYDFEWPEQIPEELRNFEGVVLTTAAQDTYAEAAWTIFFECSDKQKVADYIDLISEAGYSEVSRNENDYGLDYYGGTDSVSVSINYVAGGLSKLYISLSGVIIIGSTQEQTTETTTETTAADSFPWPVEFENWGVPVIEEAVVSLADNKSVDSEGMKQGLVAIVNLDKLSKDDLDLYISELTGSGFVKSEDESFADVMVVLNKEIENGSINATVTYDPDITTISITNSAAEAQKDAAIDSSAATSETWPEQMSGIPEFTKGEFYEIIDMTGGMYTITYKDVTESNLDWYREELENNGFILQEDAESVVYLKMDEDKTYTVGFQLTNGTLQIITYGMTL